MPTRADKANELKHIKNMFADGKVAIATDLSGYTVFEITQFRKKLIEANSRCKVVKNTLVKLATQDTEFASIDTFAKGSTAVIVGYADPVSSAKSVVEYLKTVKKGEIKGAILDRSVLSPADVKGLAELPSKEVLLSSIMGGLDSGASGIVGIFNSIIRDIALLTEEVAKKQGNT